MPLGYATVSGKSVEQLLADYGERFVAPRIGAALYQWAQSVMAKSAPLVPVDTGTLRASGYVEEPGRLGSQILLAMGYGGAAGKINPKTGQSSASYAIYVHEDLEAHHEVGQALYLSTPFNESVPGLIGFVISKVRGQGALAIYGNADFSSASGPTLNSFVGSGTMAGIGSIAVAGYYGF